MLAQTRDTRATRAYAISSERVERHERLEREKKVAQEREQLLEFQAHERARVQKAKDEV